MTVHMDINAMKEDRAKDKSFTREFVSALLPQTLACAKSSAEMGKIENEFTGRKTGEKYGEADH